MTLLNYLYLNISILLLGVSAVADVVRTPTHDWGSNYEAMVRDGRIWIRSVDARNDYQWELFGDGSIPDGHVHSISADGENLIALSSTGRIFYAKFKAREWSKYWGKPIPGKLHLPEETLAWAISHRGEAAGGYSDIAGRFHDVSAGVTTLYALDKSGTVIRYADPWLPSKFNYKIMSPERGRFVAVNMDASASTLFVIDATGRMYTRLADYDTMGENPFLSYSYERNDTSLAEKVRILPSEDWRRQPDLPVGTKVTSKIFIIQTGKGNDARQLRVMAVAPDGLEGFYSKMINDSDWVFSQVRGSIAANEIFLNRADEAKQAIKKGLDYVGQVKFAGKLLTVSVIDFSPEITTTDVNVWDGEEWVRFFLHTRKESIFRSLTPSKYYQGAVIPSDQARMKPWVQKVFGDQYAIEVDLKRSGQSDWKITSSSGFRTRIKIKMSPGQVSYPEAPVTR